MIGGTTSEGAACLELLGAIIIEAVIRSGSKAGWLLASFVFLALVIGRFLNKPSSIHGVTMSSGNTEGTVYQFLLSLAHDASHSHLDYIQPVITGGTLETMLNQVDAEAGALS